MPRPARTARVDTSAPGPWRADLRRSLHLLGEFRHEQRDPARFYSALAEDAAAHVAHHTDLDGALLVDVGGGPGYFRQAFEARGATYVALDADAGELHGAGEAGPRTVIGSGMNLPIADDAVDICYSSNVLEHVAEPWRMAEEMVRVTRPGGITFISYTTWFGPWGGHETAPWHYLGGHRAARRYAAAHGRPPKNVFGTSLFAVTVRDGLAWVDRAASGRRAGSSSGALGGSGVDVVAVVPRYNPWWSRWLLRVPVLRELVTWNLVIVLRKR